MLRNDGIIGVSDHGGWAVLATVAGDGTLLDRRRVELVDEDLPKIPHHSEGQALPLDEAVTLVERVRVSAERHAKLGLDAVAMIRPGSVIAVALRQCPELPPTIAERIKDYRAQNVADSVMYRKALAAAAEARSWAVFWYDPKKVFEAAGKALDMEDLDAHFLQLRRSIGAPWGKDHKLSRWQQRSSRPSALEVASRSAEKPGKCVNAPKGWAHGSVGDFSFMWIG